MEYQQWLRVTDLDGVQTVLHLSSNDLFSRGVKQGGGIFANLPSGAIGAETEIRLFDSPRM